MGNSALILTAGESSRFGGSPKALLPTGERSAVRRLAEISLSAGFDPVLVVVGAHASPIEHELRGIPVEVLRAENWYEGRTASIQSGLRALPTGSDVLLWPVDHPFVSARTVSDLRAVALHDLLGVWFIPTYEGRGGHPVLFRAIVGAHVLELRPDAPLRSLLPEYGPQVRRCAVGDPSVVANVDTPDAYRTALEEWSGRREE